MLSIVILIIVLGWAAFALTWGRDRMRSSNDLGFSPNPYAVGRDGFFAPPRTEGDARIRRQRVLATLVAIAILTYLMTRLWSVMWGLHVFIDIALIAFACACYMRSTRRNSPRIKSTSSWGFNQPVLREPLDSLEPVSR